MSADGNEQPLLCHRRQPVDERHHTGGGVTLFRKPAIPQPILLPLAACR